jgi:Tol biopolymer transport system component
MVRTGLLALVLSFALAPAAHAQVGYFGQNKVQYRTFDFRVLKTDHFDIFYYPEEEASARMAARMAERWYTRLSGIFGHELHNRQVVVFYSSGSQFRQTNVVEGDLGEGTGGVTEAYKRRIVLPFAGPIQATDHVLGHELVHAFQYDITSTTASGAAAGRSGVESLPLWFIEGMAEYLSIGPDDPNTAMWMREAVRRDRFPTIDKLDNPRYFPYRYGQALWAYIGGRYGDRAVNGLLRAAVGREGYRGAFQRVLGVTSKDLSDQWRDATVAAYRPVAEATRAASAFARPLIVDPSKEGGGVNVSPELSPDGSKVVFFSSRDLFSIDLYVADASTGKVIRKVTDTATNPHLESIEFIESAGAWSADSRRFVFPGLSGGNPVLTIVDVGNGRKEREVELKTLDEVLNPTWSPAGDRIAFTGLVGGVTDLFIYDLQSSQLRRVTNDAFAELQPSWSPDGATIAIATDRFTTRLDSLQAGRTRIALVDAATGQVRNAGGFDAAKNINPQWSGDGRTLYFISDRTGISNVYRMDAGGGTPAQVTNLLTGVTGITDMSPALTATASGVAFSVYENDGYNIYALDAPRASSAALDSSFGRNAGVLPPRTTAEGTVTSYLHSVAGLPPAAEQAAYPTEPYHPKLSVDFIGQPMVGVGVDSFGSYVGGGISAIFSDTLGNHVVGGGVNVSNRFDEIGGSVMYLNRTHRWNWGTAFDQTPYVVRSFSQTLTGTDAQPVVVQDETRLLQIDRGFSGILSYPLSRAQRVDVSGGLRQITGKTDVTSTAFDYFSGQEIGRETQTLSTFPTLNMAMASSALVYDTSIFGVTSPIRGTRYRLEADHTAGDLRYSAALADGRTYLMPKRPWTIALRGMYYGRFGRDAESPFLSPVFIGYPELVRGYDYNSFRASECGVTTDGSCPVFDQLFGSRMVVANAELRAPLWAAFGGSGLYGPLPIEIGVFADAGAAWAQGSSLRISGTDRNLVRSVGALLRVNLMGFAVGQLDYSRPLDRPGRGWIWQFSLRPGF